MEEKNSLEFLINALMPQTQIKKDEAETKEADKNIYTRQINALSAAIPFLDGEYQKYIFLLVKLLEFRRFAGERTALSAQSRREKVPSSVNISKMAEAVRKNLNDDERRSFDMLFKLFMLKNIAGGKNGGL